MQLGMRRLVHLVTAQFQYFNVIIDLQPELFPEQFKYNVSVQDKNNEVLQIVLASRKGFYLETVVRIAQLWGSIKPQGFLQGEN